MITLEAVFSFAFLIASLIFILRECFSGGEDIEWIVRGGRK